MTTSSLRPLINGSIDSSIPSFRDINLSSSRPKIKVQFKGSGISTDLLKQHLACIVAAFYALEVSVISSAPLSCIQFGHSLSLRAGQLMITIDIKYLQIIGYDENEGFVACAKIGKV